MGYCVGMTCSKRSFALSDELMLREDNFDAIENPPELIEFSNCTYMFV